jgi:hypothetical protein
MIVIVGAIIVIIWVLYRVYTMSDIEKVKVKDNIRISPLSYIRMDSNIVQMELIKFYSDKDKFIKKYLKNLKFKTENKPVYAVKKYEDRYEFEIYFYRYKPDRGSHIRIILDDIRKFPSNMEIDKANKNIRKCKLFDSDFIICSYDINKKSIRNGTSECNFYYGVEGGNYATNYPYYILEENNVGNIVKTNEYGLINDIMKKKDQKKYLVHKFVSGGEVVFFAKKPLKNTECIYIEGMNYKKFIKFLKYFKYSEEFIEFCKREYDYSYKFCVSYDLNDLKEVIKTTIFGMFV